MKHLKSSIKDLQELFTHSISAKHIAEPLASFDEDLLAKKVRQFMEKKDYDVVGVRKDGIVLGYAQRDKLSDGNLGKHLVGFDTQHLLQDTTPIIEVLRAMCETPRIFIYILGKVGGIVTRRRRSPNLPPLCSSLKNVNTP